MNVLWICTQICHRFVAVNMGKKNVCGGSEIKSNISLLKWSPRLTGYILGSSRTPGHIPTMGKLPVR